MPTIALLTDFGIQDTYIGVMKGVIASIAPQAQVIDLTHAIEPQGVQQAAFALMTAYRYFPPKTIFVTVVDPGVGSERRALIARAGDYSFVAPDNGLLSYVLKAYPYAMVYELNSATHRLKQVSNTFHGRDIFAPAAAHLANGENFDRMGSRIRDVVTLPQPYLRVEADSLEGEILHIDRFGNMVSSIGTIEWGGEDQCMLKAAFGARRAAQILAAGALRIACNGAEVVGLSRTYAGAGTGELMSLVGSSGFVEIAVNQGSAAQALGAKLGDRVVIRIG
jgi:S-adenosylmethionine hydrolase